MSTRQGLWNWPPADTSVSYGTVNVLNQYSTVGGTSYSCDAKGTSPQF